MSMNRRPSLIARLRTLAYRQSYVSSVINSTIAYQIRGLRKERGMDQGAFGKLVGMKQTAISRLENPDYGNLSVNTLKRIAKALDLGLIVRFAPYSEVIRWRVSMSQRDMIPPTFANDSALSTAVTTSFRGDTGAVAHTQARTPLQPLSSGSTAGQLRLRFDAEVTQVPTWQDSTSATAAGKAA
jgi:transcriptional regulator with XRE-family HTH domain